MQAQSIFYTNSLSMQCRMLISNSVMRGHEHLEPRTQADQPARLHNRLECVAAACAACCDNKLALIPIDAIFHCRLSCRLATILSFVQAVWEALSSVTASEVSSCINHGISNLDAAGSVLNSMQPPGDKAHQIPVVQCSRLIS